jgi:hypothetical protein
VITVEFFRSVREGAACEPELVARVVAKGSDLAIDGPNPELIERDQRVIDLRTGATITSADGAEDWARGLAVAFRTPYLSARVVEDTNPLGDVEIARAEVHEPVYR